jgi:DNA-binding transcriptional LysR family regulator
MEVDLHYLRVFVAVSRTGNVARAAEMLHLTASPVSRSLRELERQTGPLFERAYHDMRILPRAEALLEAAVATLQMADDFADRANGRPPVLRFAFTPYAPAAQLRAFTSALAASPLATEEMEGASSAEVTARLQHGEVDIALVHLPVSCKGVETHVLGTCRFELVVPTGDPLATSLSESGIDIEAVAGRRVLILPASMEPNPSDVLRSWIESGGALSVEEIDPLEVPTLGSKLSRAKAVSITGEGIPLHFREDQAVRLPMCGEQPTFQFGLAWRSVNPLRQTSINSVVETVAREFSDSHSRARSPSAA